MANTAVITKQSVTKIGKHGSNYNIVLNVIINDGTSNILNFNITTKYDGDMDKVKTDLQNQIKDEWDKYIANKTVLDSTVLSNAVTTLQSQANTYINA